MKYVHAGWLIDGSGVIGELKLLMEAGFCIEEAICCATGNGAELLGLSEQGHIEAGYRASLIVVPGSPAQLPESLGSIRQIYINGESYP